MSSPRASKSNQGCFDRLFSKKSNTVSSEAKAPLNNQTSEITEKDFLTKNSDNDSNKKIKLPVMNQLIQNQKNTRSDNRNESESENNNDELLDRRESYYFALDL